MTIIYLYITVFELKFKINVIFFIYISQLYIKKDVNCEMFILDYFWVFFVTILKNMLCLKF